MEVLHTITHPYYDTDLQFLKNGDEYAVAWRREEPRDLYWMSWDRMISWSLIKVYIEPNDEMDQFVLSYFPESLVTLIALEKS